jgi:hypothetical protein
MERLFINRKINITEVNMGVLIGALVGFISISLCDWFRNRNAATTWEEIIPPWAEDMPGRAFFSR